MAAGELMRNKRYRSSVNRAYFAAYSAASAALAERVMYPDDREGPGHEQVADMVTNNLGNLSLTTRRRLRRLIRTLYAARIEADYRPSAHIDLPVARDAVNNAALVLQELEVAS